MSYELIFSKDRVVATFKNEVKANEIKNAFIEIIDNINIKNIDFLIFNFSKITSYTIPKDYIEILTTITLFSSSWNTKVKIAIISTNPNIISVVNDIMQKDFIWEFSLFEKLSSANQWCK